MADVDNVTYVTDYALPGMKDFTVVASDGETFPVPGFSRVSSCQITYNEDPSTGNPWGYTVSGKTITFQCTSASDVKICVRVNGRP
jgi:hypothetical protein